MSGRASTPPAFEIHLKGSDVRPEAIPFTTLSQILSAVQQLTSGQSGPHIDKDSKNANTLRLLNVKRGSTTLPIYVPAYDHAISELKSTQGIIDNPDTIGDNDHVLNCMKELSAASRLLKCPIVVRKPGKNGEILVIFDENTYENVSRTVFISGATSIQGKIERVGNATGARCGIHIPYQDRMIVCRVQSIELARKLGQLLYEDVMVHGDAQWLKTNWKIVHFNITGVVKQKKGSFTEALEAIRDAGGDGWDEIDDPVSFIEEMTG